MKFKLKEVITKSPFPSKTINFTSENESKSKYNKKIIHKNEIKKTKIYDFYQDLNLFNEQYVSVKQV
jgi:hypothetical protein